MAKAYAFKKAQLRLLAQAADAIGYVFKRPKAEAKADPKRILVVRLDQLGDIVQTQPFFSSLKKSFPSAEIHFLTTPAGADLFAKQKLINQFHVWNCRWFDKNRQEEDAAGEWVKRLKELEFDWAFELRGDVRLITLLKRANVKNIVGYGATGGGFLLDVEVPWDPAMHAIDKNLRLLEAVHGTITDRVPHLRETNTEPVKSRVFAIHPDAGTSAKKWPLHDFVQVMNALNAAGISLMLVGTNAQMGAEISAVVKYPIDNRMGKTTLSELISSLNECQGLLSNDSGPAHLMAALGKPVWVLWSGTAEKSIWSPRGENVTLFENPVACAPCSLARCPVPGHPCLELILSSEVAESIKRGLS